MHRLEYIWLDGTEGLPQLRSKTRFCKEGDIPEWNFDGGSTNQGDLKDSDRLLKPVRTYTDPFALDATLVLCEVYNHDGTPHETNSRNELQKLDVIKLDPWIGFEQEITLIHGMSKEPLGLFLQPEKQGQYYCGVGVANAIGRDILNDFLEAASVAEVKLAGMNAEVMPGQWEFQTEAQDAKKACDDLWIARYLLERISEEKGALISYHPKPHPDYNGAGCHTNLSTAKMREKFTDKMKNELMANLQADHDDYISVCGENIEERMTGECETSDWNTFTWGVGDRGASVRIPQKVHLEGAGYIEDRRPCANIDPYKLVLSLLQTTKKSTLL